MSETQGFTAAPPLAVGYASAEVRFDFMKKTYGLLLGAIAAFVALEIALFSTGIAQSIAEFIFVRLGGAGWLLVLGGFMLANWLATTYAFKAKTRQGQINALGITVLAQTLIFIPMLYQAFAYVPGAVGKAAAVSTVGFIGLTGVALTSSKDFSFLGAMLKWIGIGALLLIVVSAFTGLTLGAWFSVAMIVFAGGAILWDTQRILKTYPEGTEVLAAIQLFSSVMLLFWYVLRLFMSRD